MINALSKGNEFCGMAAVRRLLDEGVRPERGALTLSFANVAAYESFDPARPEAAKQRDINFNRIWDDAILDAPSTASEILRARELRPFVRKCDALLDLLSNCHLRDDTKWRDPPILSFIEKPAASDVAGHMGYPLHQIGCPPGPGNLLYEYGAFRDKGSAKIGLLAECGAHFSDVAADAAWRTAIRFLAAMEVIDEDRAAALGAARPGISPVRYTDMRVPVARTDSFRWAGAFVGHDRFSRGDIVAWDGDEAVTAPYDECTLIAVAEHVGRGEGAGHFLRRI